MHALDHGMLNVPLSKRGGGSIDNQIDRYKAQVARAEKQTRKTATQELAADRVTAKALFAAVDDQQIADLAARTKQTPKAVREFLKRESHWQPKLVIRVLSGASA